VKEVRDHEGMVFILSQLNTQNLYQVDPKYIGLPESSAPPMRVNAMLSKTDAIDQLHKTLGHRAVQHCQDIVKSGHMSWKHTFEPKNFLRHASVCDACLRAKSKRSPHTGHLHIPVRVGELWYCDVWGPNEEPALLTDAVYAIGFIEARSRRFVLYHRKQKSDIYECLQLLYETHIAPLVAKGLGKFVIQSDNGEFKSDKVQQYLHSVNGERRTVCAYTPELMSVIERLWGTLHQMATAMLL
jgi:hypothetical protein